MASATRLMRRAALKIPPVPAELSQNPLFRNYMRLLLHELATPVTVMMLNAEMLATKAKEEGRGENANLYVKRMQRSATTLNKILSSMRKSL